jgi:hypothetical protein
MGTSTVLGPATGANGGCSENAPAAQGQGTPKNTFIQPWDDVIPATQTAAYPGGRITNTTSYYARLGDVVTDVVEARVLVGFHFLSSDLEGAKLGQKVGRADSE